MQRTSLNFCAENVMNKKSSETTTAEDKTLKNVFVVQRSHFVSMVTYPYVDMINHFKEVQTQGAKHISI